MTAEKGGAHQWVSCNRCGYEMDATLKDCICEKCGDIDWSAPYDDDEYCGEGND